VQTLLVESPDVLCATCHDVGDEVLFAAHNRIDVAGSNCTGCHQPHGSARDDLLLDVTHVPFADGDCQACHELPATPEGEDTP